MVKKCICFFATVIFALFTYWQLNDFVQYNTKFWYGWVVLYAVTSLLSLGAAVQPLRSASYFILGILAIAGALIRAIFINWDESIFYNDTNPAGDEAGGLLIVGLWLIFLAYIHARVSGQDIR